MKRDKFITELHTRLTHAENQGARHIDIKSGDLHRSVGGYPGPNHRMPVCCEIMYSEMKAGDEVLQAPPKGKGATVRIRYQLPRGKANTRPEPKTRSTTKTKVDTKTFKNDKSVKDTSEYIQVTLSAEIRSLGSRLTWRVCTIALVQVSLTVILIKYL